MQINADPNGGVTTTYQFNTWTPSFGRLARYNIERLAKIRSTLFTVIRESQVEKEKLKNKSVGYMKKELRILGIPTSSFRETSEFVNALSEIRANGVNESSIFSDAVQASNRLKQTTPWEPSFSDDLNTSKVSNLRGNNQTPSSPVNNRKVSSSFREKDDSNKFYSNLSQNNPQQYEHVNPSEEQKYYPRQFKQRPLQPKEQTGDYDTNGYKDVSVRKLSDEWWSADRNGNAPIDV